MHVIYIEGNARDADLTRRELAGQAPHISLDVVGTLGEARARLAANTDYDLVLTSVNLPDGSGLELVAEIREGTLPLAVVVLTGSDVGEIALAALKAGADDFVLKRQGYLACLPRVLQAALARFRSETARRTRPLRVLYAEDSAIDIDFTRGHLARYAPHIRLDVVHGASEVLRHLPRTAAEPCPCDVLVVDYCLSEVDALEVLKTVRDERHLDLPMVLVTGRGDGEFAAQAFRFGAASYVIKHSGYLFELVSVVEAAHDGAQLAREQAALRKSEERLRILFEQSAAGVPEVKGGVAHDFNNILAAIIGNAELAREDVGAQHPALASLDEIRKASRRAMELVDRILTLSRRQPQSRQALTPAPVVEETVDLLRAALPAGVEMALNPADDTPNVLADPTQIHLPAIETAARNGEPEPVTATPPRGRGQRVLYLDDDEALVMLVTQMLERLDYQVSGYTEAEAALEAVRTDPGRFDLVVTDYSMPGMSGMDVAEELARIRPDLPVVITSGNLSDELRQQAERAGVRHLIYKPNTAEELCEAVRKLT